jgi:Ulp1 family protease
VLSREQRATYKAITSSPHIEANAVVHEQWKVEVTHAHLAACAPGQWLSDPVINLYMALLQVCHLSHTFDIAASVLLPACSGP